MRDHPLAEWYFPIFIRCHPAFAHWATEQLEALGEESLWREAADPAAHAYRFLWLRTFHQPLAVRLDLAPDGAGRLALTIAGGRGGDDPDSVAHQRPRPVTRDEVSALLDRVHRLGFWEVGPVLHGSGIDGAIWLVEGIRDGSYQLMQEWSPRDGALRSAALLLVKMAGVTVGTIY